jgi:hypothetical protein
MSPIRLTPTRQFISHRSAEALASFTNRETTMSKGMERKKEDRKKPTKSLKEKRADKQAKKAAKG